MIVLIALAERITLEHRHALGAPTIRTHEESAIGIGAKRCLPNLPTFALSQIRVHSRKVDEVTGDAMTEDPHIEIYRWFSRPREEQLAPPEPESA